MLIYLLLINAVLLALTASARSHAAPAVTHNGHVQFLFDSQYIELVIPSRTDTKV